MHKSLILIVNLLLTSIVSCDFQLPLPDSSFGSKDEKLKAEKQQQFPPCKSCSVFVNSFKKVSEKKINLIEKIFSLLFIMMWKKFICFLKGLEKTARGKHDGGDAHWEEKKLGSYKTSELRLVEIQEMLCNDIGRGEQQCHHIAEEHESDIEYWWKHQEEYPDLFQWFCIDKLKTCCPQDHYGKDCQECSNCNGNGVCKGNGTRKGNGKCNCDKGYAGENCFECADGFYEAFKDESKLLCSQCHVACYGSCKGPGPRKCEKCREGWFHKENEGCFDVDECIEKSPCDGRSHFCVNNEGSYSCLECDKSCAGCDGDGPDMCVKCKDGFEFRDGMCAGE